MVPLCAATTPSTDLGTDVGTAASVRFGQSSWFITALREARHRRREVARRTASAMASNQSCVLRRSAPEKGLAMRLNATVSTTPPRRRRRSSSWAATRTGPAPHLPAVEGDDPGIEHTVGRLDAPQELLQPPGPQIEVQGVGERRAPSPRGRPTNWPPLAFGQAARW